MSPQQRRNRLRDEYLAADPATFSDSMNDQVTLMIFQDVRKLLEGHARLDQQVQEHERRIGNAEQAATDMRRDLDNPDGIHHLAQPVVVWITGWYGRTHDFRKAFLGLVLSSGGLTLGAGGIAIVARHFGA